ncbi:MAG: SHOCT domain-containing protein [Candidatus Wenzhouxiangella sp. M2_3B_020]
MGFGMIFWVLLLVVIVWAVARGLPQWTSRPEAPTGQRETPLQIVERRYADGEITTEEYEERKSRLQGKGR